jgi:Activator of Hsp90 ATPase homolog 1-like protein
MTPPPLKISFDLACPAAHAFEVWTLRIGTWWPSDHTVTGHPDQVVLQAGVGGRIFERTADGVEHDWGHVTGWDPPKQLTYLWHLGADPSNATEVEIQFLPLGEAATRVEIEHRGWEVLGDAGSQWRDRNRDGWSTLLPHFQAALAKGDQ